VDLPARSFDLARPAVAPPLNASFWLIYVPGDRPNPTSSSLPLIAILVALGVSFGVVLIVVIVVVVIYCYRRRINRKLARALSFLNSCVTFETEKYATWITIQL